ncbi:MAG TPA: fibronectin-binding domain-containing protein [Archaeoglobus profundus]|nr:fibronectin-binding domain-containing protein [Archaeoglobus profundus]
MKSMSAVDIKACISELKEEIVGGKIEKIYHYPPNEIRIKLYARGRKDLIIEAGRRIHLTKFPKESPKFPTSFAMLLRKHLEGGKIKNIEQYDFDRVIKIEVERKDGKKIIIAELFSKGNVILTDENLKVIMPLKLDLIKPGELYKFPEPRLTPLNIDEDTLKSIFTTESKEVVKVLATKCGLGGLFAEEVCLRAGIDKKKKCNEINDEDVKKILESIKDVFKPVLNGDFKPYIVVDNGKFVDVLPIELKFYDGYKKRYFEKFNEALDEFYSRLIIESIEKKEKEENEELKKLKKRLEIQLETKERYEKEMEKYRRIGDLIYEKYSLVDKIINAFRQAKERMPFDELKRRAKQISIVKEVKPDSVKVELDGHIVELEFDKDVHEIADKYYEKAKKIKEKLDGLLQAIEKTKEEMKRIEELEAKKYITSVRIVRRREWFERFRWFITSDGFLVIGGRNAQMNEEIVSKYMEDRDLFFHTQAPGAPVTILKNGQNAPETSILEAAQFAAIYSSLWKEGKHSGEVYYVLPEQVKKAAKAGEYLPKGSFYIVGKRNYLTVELSCGIGVDISNLRVFGGPISAVKKYCDYYVELEIGDKDANEIAIEIASKLTEMAKEEERHLVKSIATPDEIMKFLPPGKSRIKV